MQNDSELIWHNDGHEISLRIEKSELVVAEVTCPNAKGSACHNLNEGCVVKWFIQRFGMECNVGVCDPAPLIEIAWALVGDLGMGVDSCQVWFIPTKDDFFAAWSVTQTDDIN